MKKQLAHITAQVMSVSPEVVEQTEFLFDLPGWNSITHLQIVEAIETALGTHFDREQVYTFFTLEDVLQALPSGEGRTAVGF